MNEQDTGQRQPYIKPQLDPKGNISEITFECAGWQCSVVVPPPPQ